MKSEAYKSASSSTYRDRDTTVLIKEEVKVDNRSISIKSNWS